MSLFGILRFSSLLWLRRRTSCSASVPVTGSSVSVEFHRRQLDLVTGIAALLAVDMRERAPFAHALGLVAGQDQIWPPSGRPLSRSQPYMPHVSASRPNSFSRRVEPPPRSPNRSRRTTSHRGKVLRSYVSVPAASGIPACPRTFACTRPHLLGSAGFPGEYGAGT
jgi:hypothetical protein